MIKGVGPYQITKCARKNGFDAEQNNQIIGKHRRQQKPFQPLRGPNTAQVEPEAPAFEVGETGFDGKTMIVPSSGLSGGGTVGDEKDVPLLKVVPGHKDVGGYRRLLPGESTLRQQSSLTGSQGQVGDNFSQREPFAAQKQQVALTGMADKLPVGVIDQPGQQFGAVKLTITGQHHRTVVRKQSLNVLQQGQLNSLRRMPLTPFQAAPGNRNSPLLVPDADHQAQTATAHTGAVNQQHHWSGGRNGLQDVSHQRLIQRINCYPAAPDEPFKAADQTGFLEVVDHFLGDFGQPPVTAAKQAGD